MFEQPTFWIVLILLISLFLWARTRIARDNERFAIHILGQFKGFKEPGLHIKYSGKEIEWTRIKANDRGKVVTSDMIRIGEIDVPFKADNQVRLGGYVRVSGFEKDCVLVIVDEDQRNSFVCEKCGHQNYVR